MVHKPNMELMRQRYNQLREQKSRQGSGTSIFWYPKKGINVIRLLPPWSEAGTFFKETAEHRNVGADSKIYTCYKPKGEPCPICDLAYSLKGSADQGLQGMGDNLRPRSKYLANIIDRTAEDSGVRIAIVGWTVYNELMGVFCDPNWGDFTDLSGGRDVTIERTGEGLDTEYRVRCSPVQSPLSSDQAKATTWIQGLKNLDSHVKFLSSEELEVVLSPVKELLGTVAPAPATAPMPTVATPPPLPKPAASLPPAKPTAKASASRPAPSAPLAPAPTAPAPEAATTMAGKPMEYSDKPIDVAAMRGKNAVTDNRYVQCFASRHDGDAENCMLCPHEYPCKELIAKFGRQRL